VDVISDPPVPRAIKWLFDAMEYFDVQIYSSRSKNPDGVKAMRGWLEVFAAHEFGDIEKAQQFVAALKFPIDKPAAFLMIDDRAICFGGDFAALDPEELLKFKPWYKRDSQ
jgi:hypothetical protein